MLPIAPTGPTRLALVVASTLVLAASPARAAVTTFAQFANRGVNDFRCSSNVAGAMFNKGNIPAQFNDSSLLTLSTGLQDKQTSTLTLGPGTGSAVTFAGDFLDFSRASQLDSGLRNPTGLTEQSINANGLPDPFAVAGPGTVAGDSAPIVVPEADARLALGYLVGVVGLWELFRRLRSGWARAGREELEVS